MTKAIRKTLELIMEDVNKIAKPVGKDIINALGNVYSEYTRPVVGFLPAEFQEKIYYSRHNKGWDTWGKLWLETRYYDWYHDHKHKWVSHSIKASACVEWCFAYYMLSSDSIYLNIGGMVLAFEGFFRAYYSGQKKGRYADPKANKGFLAFEGLYKIGKSIKTYISGKYQSALTEITKHEDKATY